MFGTSVADMNDLLQDERVSRFRCAMSGRRSDWCVDLNLSLSLEARAIWVDESRGVREGEARSG